MKKLKYECITPTHISSFIINGKTIHSALSINYMKKKLNRK